MCPCKPYFHSEYLSYSWLAAMITLVFDTKMCPHDELIHVMCHLHTQHAFQRVCSCGACVYYVGVHLGLVVATRKAFDVTSTYVHITFFIGNVQ